MISLQEALSRIDEHVQPLAPAEVPIHQAVGCAVAEEVRSQLDVQPFTNSAMDGIALNFGDIKGDGPWIFKLDDVIAAGDSREFNLRAGFAVKIMTGAPVPPNADTVVPVEEVEFIEDGVRIKKKPKSHQHIRPRGDDICKGERLFKAGAILKPVDIGVLASIGRDRVMVIPKPKIALFSTGSEIVAPGNRLLPGQIYNSNNASLCSLLMVDGYLGADVLSPARDDMKSVSKVLHESLASNHVVITSGGISVGDYDFVPQAVHEVGGTIIFHKVKVKPGKPILLAKFESAAPLPTLEVKPKSVIESKVKWLIGLPGNPVSVILCYHLYVRRVLGKLMGIPFTPRKSTARLSEDIKKTSDRLSVVGVKIERTELGYMAYPAKRQKSARLSSIKEIDGFILVAPDNKILQAGSEVEVEWL
jgi:molybdopterin molybdotransferase